MKKVFLTSLLAVIGVLGMTFSVFSQNTSIAMGETPAAPAMLLSEGTNYNSAVNTKAMRSFKKMFTSVEGEKWYEYKGAYAAVFAADDVRFRVEYDARGNWSATEKDYFESKLDRDVRKVVKSVYFDYTITSIREITTSTFFSTPVYIIHIEDASSFKNIAVYEGEMSIVDQYLKD
jgi:hypothetical protein